MSLPLRSTVALASALLTVSLSPTLSAEPYKEAFNQVTDGQPLDVLDGWAAQSGGGDGWVLSTTGGYEGGALQASKTGIFQHHLGEDTMGTPDKGPWTFRAKVRVDSGTDAYTYLQLDLLSTGGVNGIGLRFNGSKDSSAADNAIEVSTGGRNWGDITYNRVDAPWESGTWYQVEFKDIWFSSDGVTAKISVWPVDSPDNKLVEDAEAQCYGAASSFQKINLISIGSKGADRAFTIDEIEFGPGEQK